MPANVYRDLCIHWDYHPDPGIPAYGRGTNPDAIREYIRRVRPEVMQYHTIGTATPGLPEGRYACRRDTNCP